MIAHLKTSAARFERKSKSPSTTRKRQKSAEARREEGRRECDEHMAQRHTVQNHDKIEKDDARNDTIIKMSRVKKSFGVSGQVAKRYHLGGQLPWIVSAIPYF